MGFFYHLERQMNNLRQHRANDRRWKRRRQREKLPDPIHTWTKEGCIIECFVVRSGVSIWGELEVLFRLGTVKITGTAPKFSSHFSARQSAVLLELIDEAKSWSDVFSSLRLRDTIPARRWRTILEAQQKPSLTGSKIVGTSGRVFARAVKVGHAPGTLYTLCSENRQSKNFFTHLDLPDLEEQLFCMVQDERVMLDLLFKRPPSS